MNAPAIALDNLHTVLDTERGLVRVVEALTLAIGRGETFALVGESGCGKSMTAASILRLLPDNGRVERGAVRLDDTDLVQLPEARMREVRGRRIGMIFQEPGTSLNPVLRVGDQIVEAIELHTPLRGKAARAQALDWLRRVGLPEPERRIDGYPFQLSGGQKQRVMIAIALAARPDVLLADEPTTALDVTIQKQILDLLRDLQREQGMALLLITHDLGIVAEMAQRVALMYAGQIVEIAPAAEFLARPRHPYARLLLDALPATAHRGRALAAIGGTVPALDQEFVGCRFAERCPRVIERCRSEAPELVASDDGRAVRCLLAIDRYDPPDASANSLLFKGRAGVGMGLAAQEPIPVPTFPSLGKGWEQAETDASETPLLELRDYRVWFPIRSGLLKRATGYVKAVDGISFSLHVGRTLALVGESGCGKTTTGKALLQLLHGSAHVQGEALLDGRPLHRLHGEALRAARQHMQIVFQDPFASLNPRLRVAEILEEGLAALRPELEAAERTRRIATLIDRVGLRRDALSKHPHEFSGGQRQRLAIARALAVEPRLIVCDEPTSALDVSVQAQILNLLRELQDELGVAYLFITHNFGVVEYLADEIAVMQGGRIVEAGPAQRVLGAPQADYTRTLLAAVPRGR
ncbi:MAG: dipeptide ABC transporter ATP-binding protein [Betaproteobacteria bacterium]